MNSIGPKAGPWPPPTWTGDPWCEAGRKAGVAFTGWPKPMARSPRAQLAWRHGRWQRTGERGASGWWREHEWGVGRAPGTKNGTGSHLVDGASAGRWHSDGDELRWPMVTLGGSYCIVKRIARLRWPIEEEPREGIPHWERGMAGLVNWLLRRTRRTCASAWVTKWSAEQKNRMNGANDLLKEKTGVMVQSEVRQGKDVVAHRARRRGACWVCVTRGRSGTWRGDRGAKQCQTAWQGKGERPGPVCGSQASGTGRWHVHQLTHGTRCRERGGWQLGPTWNEIQKQKIKFGFQTGLRLICSKSGLPQLKKIEIKYWKLGFKVRNNFDCFNVPRFEFKFEWKIREDKVLLKPSRVKLK
jgi:hypothetical protein